MPHQRQARKHVALSTLLALVLSLPVMATARDYPADPFAFEREPLRASEIGSARGQTQLSVLGALVSGNASDDIYFGGKLGAEFMLHEFVALRLTGFQDLTETDFESIDYRLTSVRAGSALHLQPYRRVDLGPYSEGGIVSVNRIGPGKSGDTAPEVVIGGFITIHLTSSYFMRLELERAWARLDLGDGVRSEYRTAALAGFGVLF